MADLIISGLLSAAEPFVGLRLFAIIVKLSDSSDQLAQ
jgi:hypothetical protein